MAFPPGEPVTMTLKAHFYVYGGVQTLSCIQKDLGHTDYDIKAVDNETSVFLSVSFFII